jgi:hypothetical protein
VRRWLVRCDAPFEKGKRVASPLREVDEIVMLQPKRRNPPWWWSLLDGHGRQVGRAWKGHVRDAQDVLIVLPGRVRWRRPETVLTGDGSLVGTLTVARTEDGRKKRNSFHLRLGDSEQEFAEYTDGTVRLAGAEGKEVATIVGTSNGTDTWYLTFSSCDNPRLRLMSLCLLGELAVNPGGGVA